jgi:hypothetical protein
MVDGLLMILKDHSKGHLVPWGGSTLIAICTQTSTYSRIYSYNTNYYSNCLILSSSASV